jgi:hypothetical protein
LKRICQSKKIANLKTDGARLLYTWLIPNADINGCFSGEVDVIKGQIFTRLKKSDKVVHEYLDDLDKNGLILLYENEGDIFLIIPDFADKQPCLNPTKEATATIPLPTQDQLQSRSGVTPYKVKESKVKESKKTPLSKKPKRVFPDNCVEMEISKYLFKVLLKSDKNNKKPNFQNWCLVVDSILRLDNRSKEDTMKVIDYAHDPANSKPAFSWIPNLRSPTALRKHFTKILIQANVVNVENTENPALTKQEIADLLK